MTSGIYSGFLGGIRQPGKLKTILIRTALSVGILGLLLWWLPTEHLVGAFLSIEPITWVIVITGFLVGHIVSAFKWRLLMSAVHIQIFRLEAVRAHGAGLFANLCLPSIVGGDLVRAGLVIRDRGEATKIAVASLADRLNDTLALILMAGIAGLFVTGKENVIGHQVIGILAGLMLLAVVTGIIIFRMLPAHRLPKKVAGILVKVNTSVNALMAAPMLALSAFLLSLIIQSAFVLLNILIARDIGLPDSYALWFFAWPIAKLIALLPISLGGIGVREIALAGIMLPFGVNSAHVVSQSLSWEVVLIVSGLIAGMAANYMPGYKNKV